MENSNEKGFAIGNLLLRAGSNEIVKRVISVFDHTASRSANISAFKSLNLDMLEPCAEFLNIKLADADHNKLFTKEMLISRIVLEIRALLPAECSECNQTYVSEFDSEHKPLFNCHMCYRGSHSCSATTNLHDALSGASLALLSGHVWLCKACRESSDPYKPRKTRARHDSTRSVGNLSNFAAPPITETLDENPDPAHRSNDRSEDTENAVSANQEKICEKYKRGKCPHGLRGNKKVNGQACEFQHPKYCSKFCRFGTQKKFGCSRGSECKFLHPILCKFSVKKKMCTNAECTYIHLKGTRRKEGENYQSQKKAGDRPGTVKNKARTDPPNSTGSTNDSNHFLELKRLVDTMQTSFLREIAEIRSSLSLTVHSLPRPQYPLQTGPMCPQYQNMYPPLFHPVQLSQNVPNIHPASS